MLEKPPVLAALFLLVACSSAEETPAPRVPAEGDALILQQVLDGALPAEEGLRRIAHSDGLPIETTQGFLFAVRDEGLGPYSVEGVGGAFARAPMTSHRGVAFAVVPVAAPDGAAYQLVTRHGDAFADPLSRHYDHFGGDERSLVRESGPRLERWPQVADEAGAVAPRTVRVSVPAEPPTHFLYVQDGQNVFDPGAAFGGWRLQDAAGPRTLVVGVDNTPARFTEYTHVPDDLGSGPVGGGGAAYADYVELTVRPFVEARYGTPARVGVMGSSLGGLVSWYQALRFPGSYDLAASLSGTMGWGSIGAGQHAETIVEAYAALASCPQAALYLDSGGAGGVCDDVDGDGLEDDVDGGDNYCVNLQLRDLLVAKGCPVTYVWAQGALHNEIAWRVRSPAILDLFEAL